MSPTEQDIRSDIVDTIELISEIVETAQGGDRLALALKIAAAVPELLSTGVAFNAATAEEKVDYGVEGFDLLIGNDATAIVKSIGPLTPDTVEAITDAMKNGVREIYETKFLPEGPTG